MPDGLNRNNIFRGRPAMNYINELREGEMVSEVYLCKTKQILKTKAGKTYYSMILQDKTGNLDAKIWELTNAIAHFDAMDYIKVEGQVTSFNGSLQLNVKRVRIADAGEYDESDYMPCSEKNPESMYSELTELIASVKEPNLQALLTAFFVEDKEFATRFMRHSAAKSIHHAFIGGLLEHTLSVARICDFLAGQYDILNRDLLITAALFHDIAKVNEISAFPENDYTDEGQFLGHIVMGVMMIDEKIKTMQGFPKELELELKHCILAHHGELEFGSPKKPAIIEAMALSHADNLDAKMETFREVLSASEDKTKWLGYNKMFESNIKATV